MNTDNFIVYLILPALLVIMCLICWDSSKKSAAEIQMNEARRGYNIEEEENEYDDEDD